VTSAIGPLTLHQPSQLHGITRVARMATTVASLWPLIQTTGRLAKYCNQPARSALTCSEEPVDRRVGMVGSLHAGRASVQVALQHDKMAVPMIRRSVSRSISASNAPSRTCGGMCAGCNTGRGRAGRVQDEL
jgi:hypothetical protein